MTLITCPRCGRQVAGGRFCPGCGARLDDPQAGKLLAGKWKLVAQTAKGPFFATYRGEPKAGGVPVSVKVLDPAIAEDDARRRRFLENAGAALSLTDRRLLAVREMAEEPLEGGGSSKRTVYAVADAPGGPSLADVVAKQGPLDPARAAACVRGVLEALGAVHKAELVHGDLHPGCVFLEPDGAGREVAKLADAGIAPGLALSNPEEGDPAALGSDGGRWLAPEQAAGQAAGAAADIHAAGALLYFALTGVPPWQAERGSALLFEIQRSSPRAASEVKSGVPTTLDAVMDRALAKGPRERYGSAAEFGRALASAAANLAAIPTPALPEDVTPGAIMLGGSGDAGGDATIAAPRASAVPPDPTIAAPRASAVPPDATMTAVSRAPPAPRAPQGSGDETIIGTSTPPRGTSPPPRAPAVAPPTAAPARQASRKAPPPAAKPAGKLAPARSAQRSAERAPAARPAAREEEPAAAPPAAPAKPGKVRGAWSVGTPVGIFAILGFLAVGGLYGIVWAGYLDWKIPPWLRVLTGREETAHIGDGPPIPVQALFETNLVASMAAPICLPLEGSPGKDAVYGRWRLVKDPAEDAPSDGGASPAPAGPAEEKVYATGDFRGEPDSTGGLPVRLRLPAGRYRFFGTFRYGVLEKNLVEVKDSTLTKSFHIEPHATVLMVRLKPEVGKVSVKTLEMASPLESEVVKGEGVAVFGIPREKKVLKFGDVCDVTVKATGYKDATRKATLLNDPEVLEITLDEDAKGKVGDALLEIEKDGHLSFKYENDGAVLHDPSVMVALARVDAKNGAWVKVAEYLELLKTALGNNPLPSGADELYEAYHLYLRSRAAEAARKGDLHGLQELRGKARPEALPATKAAEERALWAQLEIQAWLAFPPTAAAPGSPAPNPEITPLERMVNEDLRLVPEAKQDGVRKEVARRILENRAWPAWRAGNELRTPAAAEKGSGLTVPGPSVRPWLDLALKACPDLVHDPVLNLSWQRLAARLEDLEKSPERVVAQLLADPDWKAGKSIPDARLETLFKKDKLLLARALARWGDLRQESNSQEALKLWQESWNVYQKVFDLEAAPDSPEKEFSIELSLAARLEGARMALLSRGDVVALEVLNGFLKIRGGDPVALRMKVDLERRGSQVAVPELLRNAMVDIPEGPFLVGSAEQHPDTEEQPWTDPKAPKVPVNVLFPARRYAVREFLVGIREVTKGQYRKYLQAMEDGTQADRLRHPDEPPEKRAKDARKPEGFDGWSDEDPVRGVDWWDAFACCRFLGGRLPTEAEWEKAARWGGRETPVDLPMDRLRHALTGQWTGFWPDNARDVSDFDFAPSGAKAFWGGVAEWTLDAFDAPPPGGLKEGTVEAVPAFPPVLRAGNNQPMCVRGGSYYHLAPGETPGESLVERKERAGQPAPGQGAQPERPRMWRGMDILERRGVPAGIRAKWIGFRVVVATQASVAPR